MLDSGFAKDYIDITDHYGLDTQLMKLAEECAEYSAACLKWHVYEGLANNQANPSRKYFSELCDKAGEDCVKELADVLVLSRQIEWLLQKKSTAELREAIEKEMKGKVQRQLNRIEEEKRNAS